MKKIKFINSGDYIFCFKIGYKNYTNKDGIKCISILKLLNIRKFNSRVINSNTLSIINQYLSQGGYEPFGIVLNK